MGGGIRDDVRDIDISIGNRLQSRKHPAAPLTRVKQLLAACHTQKVSTSVGEAAVAGDRDRLASLTRFCWASVLQPDRTHHRSFALNERVWRPSEQPSDFSLRP